MKLECKDDGGGGSREYVQVTAADSCRMREIEGVGIVELVYIGRLLRMGGDSLLGLCGDLLEIGSLAKGSRMCG